MDAEHIFPGRRILALVPARGGSKTIKNKNIVDLAGKPLIGWTLDTALNTPCLDRVVVSTDSEEIAAVARDFGAETPFMRPAELAGDQAGDLEVYRHALGWLRENQGYVPDIVVWLRPTAPLRAKEDIVNCVQVLVGGGADWVRSVCPVRHHPYWCYKEHEQNLVPFVDGIRLEDYFQRQLLPPAFYLNGAVDAAWEKVISRCRRLYQGSMQGYVMPYERSVDIDDHNDLDYAAFLIQR